MTDPCFVATSHELPRRLRLDLTGAVQGVGMRPFIHRLAVAEGLGGFVRNTSEGVTVEVEGSGQALDRFLLRLDAEIKPPAQIHERRMSRLRAQQQADFEITPSAVSGAPSALVLPDLAPCPDCLNEVFDPSDRRYLYPFTTCMHCGPRYSIIESIPYDRARTAMRRFTMCSACQREYDDPTSRRFHAEANACPECGPELALWDATGRPIARQQRALQRAAEALRAGKIVALKGLGGFQLLADARNERAVYRLREAKKRPAKPFALMAGTLADALGFVQASDEEQRLLCSAAAPIVLLKAHGTGRSIAPNVAPDNPCLGVMLPSTPLHHLLMRALGFPVVATSGNLGGAPIIAREEKALETLAQIADLFLVHDRPILHAIDDSVVRVIAGRSTVIRHARGYAPSCFSMPATLSPVLALGGHQKNAIAMVSGTRLVLGPHIGDLESPETRNALGAAVADITARPDSRPTVVASDRHPDYYTSRLAQGLGPPVRPVLHHLAHVLAGMLDNSLQGPVLGIAWDGTGYGDDGTIWGGEFLNVDSVRYRRLAHMLPFRLPGGETAMREPRRAALGVLHALFGEKAFGMTELDPVAAFAPDERKVLARMITRGLNSPVTSSAGRLFDAVSSLIGLRQTASFEGQAAMDVEFAAERASEIERLPSPVVDASAHPAVVDWRPTLAGLLDARRDNVSADRLAAGFHEALADAIVLVAAQSGIRDVLLTGGCFQNARLTERAVARLRAAGFVPHWHHRIPPNDGGIASGQAVFAARPCIEEIV